MPSAWISFSLTLPLLSTSNLNEERWVLKLIFRETSDLPNPPMDGAGNQAPPTLARSMSLSLKDVKARWNRGGKGGDGGEGWLDVGCCGCLKQLKMAMIKDASLRLGVWAVFCFICFELTSSLISYMLLD